MNTFCFTGNLGKDCRTGNVAGTSVVNFSVAVKSGYGDKEQTVWVDCAQWGKSAEGRLPEYLTKGQQVAVSGELSTQEKDGKTYLKVRCNTVSLIGSKSDAPRQPQQAPQQQPRQTPPQGVSGPAPVDDFDDDIPF